ncbi:MAG: hypothetical protein NT062_33565 [Proteobacteria bacterium]|nr:hypothetical protein [Pseudomonadota bacterium]
MRRLVMVMVLLVGTACGKGGVGWECRVDADCDKGLLCGLLQSPDGSKRTMCVDSDNTVNLTDAPKSYRSYALPIAVGGAFLVVLLMLRASVIAREKRKRARTPPR